VAWSRPAANPTVLYVVTHDDTLLLYLRARHVEMFTAPLNSQTVEAGASHMKAASTNRRGFIPYPTNRVVGTVSDAAKARAAIDALLRAGFDREDIEMLHGDEDLHRLDPTGAEHGFLAQFQRSLIRAFELEEFKQLTHYVEDLRAGRFVIMVLTKRRVLRIVAADILHLSGAEFVGFYGRWACEELPATAQTSPEAIPVLFARAWNERNPDALASLFDEDAEFVNVTGLCWHNRESIRKAFGLDGVFNKSTLATGETKVKLLSPDIAVVHTRMTLSGVDPADSMTQPGPRTTIVSFVVHRAGDRWLCATAHNTDVMPGTDATVMDAAGDVGVANYPSDQVS
jgi:uncharacterized protein (TIGR02246 family)